MADWMLNRRVLPWLVTLGAFLMWEGVVRTHERSGTLWVCSHVCTRVCAAACTIMHSYRWH